LFKLYKKEPGKTLKKSLSSSTHELYGDVTVALDKIKIKNITMYLYLKRQSLLY